MDELTQERHASSYRVVVNDEEQYSIWPTDKLVPSGWRNTNKIGTKTECILHINHTWRDTSPRKHREVETNGAREPSFCAHELFEQQVRKAPDRIALVYENQRITYAELNKNANRMARKLQDRHVGLEGLVGIYLKSSPEAVAALLAVLKVGGAFVPLDPSYPRDRLEYMIQDCSLTCILTSEDLQDGLTCPANHILLVDDSPASEDEVGSNLRPGLDNLSCVLYTSGSTGRPKGVLRLHRAITNRLTWFPFREDDVLCHNMSLNVGFSQERLFLALMRGLPLVVIPDESFKDVRQQLHILETTGVTNITLVPGILRQYLSFGLELGRRLTRLRTIAVGGAPLTEDLVTAFAEAIPHAELLNAYGTVESGSIIRGTVDFNAISFPVTIGKPVADAAVYLLDSDAELVPPGDTGEMFVSAPCLARGYLNHPGQTAERFVPNPFGGVIGKRLYRTGDMARHLPNGQIELIGRADRQVKIRGFRVELDEVEVVLSRHPMIKEVFICATGDGDEKRLAAYIAYNGTASCTVSQLRRYLLKEVPEYMVPAAFVVVSHLPRSLNWKVDMSALPAVPPTRPVLDVPYAAAETSTQYVVAQIWADVLGLSDVGIHDHFLELGGDSLSAVQVLFRVRDLLGVDTTLNNLLDHPTVLEFSLFLDERTGNTEVGGVSKIKRIERDEVLPLSFNQQVELHLGTYASMLSVPRRQLQTVDSFSIKGVLDITVLENALNTIIDRHEVLRTGFSLLTADRRSPLADEIAQMSPFGPSLFEPVIRPHVSFKIPVVNFEGSRSTTRYKQILSLLAELTESPFDYASPPLMRTALVRTSRETHLLLIVWSHLVADGQSRQVFQKELETLCARSPRAESLRQPDLPIQYVDFARWQWDLLRTPVGKQSQAYWVKRFEEFSPVKCSDLPFARQVSSPSYSVASNHISLDENFIIRLRAFAKARKVTLYTVLLCSLMVVLRLYTNRNKIAVWGMFANRSHPDTEDLIGWFAHPLLLGVDFGDDPELDTLLEATRVSVVEAMAHQEFPLGLLVSRNKNAGGGTGSQRADSQRFAAVADHMAFDLVSSKAPVPETALKMHRVSLPLYTNSALKIVAFEEFDRLVITARYHTDRFASSDVQRMLADVRQTLNQLADGGVVRVSDLVKARQHRGMVNR